MIKGLWVENVVINPRLDDLISERICLLLGLVRILAMSQEGTPRLQNQGYPRTFS